MNWRWAWQGKFFYWLAFRRPSRLRRWAWRCILGDSPRQIGDGRYKSKQKA